jgi:hypothetical protein
VNLVGGQSLKKGATLGLVVLIAFALVIPQTIAITSQGLFYRMADGDRFYFTLDRSDEGVVSPTEIIYFEVVDASKTIPDPLTNLTDLDWVDMTVYYENGTAMGLEALMFLFLAGIEYPVGNWDLINTLAATDLDDIILPDARDLSITSDADNWSFTYKTNSTNDTENTVWGEYSMFDGMFSYYRVEYVNTTTSELLSHFEVNRFSYHNLMWGYQDGDRFDFRVILAGDQLGFQDLDEMMYIEIDDDGLPTIPAIMTDFDDLPHVGADLYWANGTISFDSFFSHTWKLSMPIGNWSVVSDMTETLNPAANVTLDAPDLWFWGYSRDVVMGDVHHQVHTDYLKVDGFLSRHTAVFTNTTNSEIIGTITIERTGLLPYTDRTVPEINHPDDVTFVEGVTGQNITWIATDDNPTTYEIALSNGTIIDSGSWTSGTPILLDLDDFEAGTYECTITVNDIGSNYATDTVLVTVTAPAGGILDFIMDNLLYIGIGVAVVVILGAVVLIRRR